MKSVNRKNYYVYEDEFKKIDHKEFSNLRIFENVGLFERLVSLLEEFSNFLVKINISKNISKNIFLKNITHGGFIPLEISNFFENIYIQCDKKHIENIYKNMELMNIQNLKLNENNNEYYNLIFEENISDIFLNNLYNFNNTFIISENDYSLKYENIYKLSNTNYKIYIPSQFLEDFKNHFHYFLNEEKKELEYDNLINLCMIVKNAGDDFEKILTENLPIIDHWTILDTGSTDNTIEIINRVLVGKKKGNLYQDPFIDFKVSRNRCLDLAESICKYNLMLDDTYVINGDLRYFLNEVRGDQFADSFSFYIRSDDSEYTSNRLTVSDRNLRYIYKIHEVITPKNNNNVIIPIHYSYIYDSRSDYMQNRTMNRKELDLKLLFEELDENPNDPRTYYYLGQTYNLLEKYDLALEYFLKRANHPEPGFIQEKIDAIFEAGRLSNFKLNKPWEDCKKLYEWSYSLDECRPDSLYFIGIHYYLEGPDQNKKLAYDYFKKCFELGYPVHCQYSLKPTLSFYFLPKFLVNLCYEFNNFELGLEVSTYFFEKNQKLYVNVPELTEEMFKTDYEIMESWYRIFLSLNKRVKPSLLIPKTLEKPILAIVADGGFKKWSGSSILKEGVGGSETWIIETSRYLNQFSGHHILVFCNCEREEYFEGVEYRPIEDFFNVCMFYKIDYCIISRFSEYIPVAIHSNVENIYFIMHDLGPSGKIIPLHSKLKKIYCLSEWHKSYFLNEFPQCKEITEVCSYGINSYIFEQFKKNKKIKDSFIYSSYPNRGLIYLLKYWEHIKEKIPNASLHIYCDFNNSWSNQFYPEMMKEIKELYNKKKDMDIINYGWVSKEVLLEGWSKYEYWVYPCIFKETFCLTAYEAGLSKTLAITNNLAGLENTVGDRGIEIATELLEINPKKWIEEMIEIILNLSEKTKREYIEKNYNFVLKNSWKNKTIDLILDIFFENKELIYKILQTEFEQKNYESSKRILAKLKWKNEIENLNELEKYNLENIHFNNDKTYVGFLLDDEFNSNDNLIKQFINFYKNVGFEIKIFDKEKDDFISFTKENYVFRLFIFGYSKYFLYSIENDFIDFVYLVSKTNKNLHENYNMLSNKIKVKYIFLNEDKYSDLFLKNENYISIDDSIFNICGNDLFEYKGMLNWTNDLPKGTKKVFDNILNYVKKKNKKELNILEIGSYTGVSIINMLNYLPNANGLSIDMWESYNENNLLENMKNSKVELSFMRNRSRYNMENRLEFCKGNSHDILRNLINENKKFDLIYVDGSHLYKDCKKDIELSWIILNNGGIMIMDDYLYNLENGIEFSPYHAINEFLNEKENEIIILNKGYRVFLEKL